MHHRSNCANRSFARATTLLALPTLAAGLSLSLSSGCTIEDDGRDIGGINLDTGAVDAELPGARGDDGDDADGAPADVPVPDGLAGEFALAGEEFDVPASLLDAISQVETGYQMVSGSVEFEGKSVGHGVMGLRSPHLERGAELAGVTNEAARTDRAENVRAAAAVLSEMADEQGIAVRDDLTAWTPVLRTYSGIAQPEALESYVSDEVLPALRDAAARVGDGVIDELALPDTDPQTRAVGPDYSGSIWRASPNNSSRGSYSPDMVIIHTCEGSYSGCWGWLTNSASGVSAHYVVNSTGSEISQLVREDRKAWHIGATYDCNRNSGVECGKNGVGSNNFTVGIEHAGYASQKSWNDDMIDASAELVCDITDDHSIPRDEYHIVGHGQLQPYNRVDPGANWPWTDYLNLIDAYCGGATPPPSNPTPPPSNPTPPPPSSPSPVDITIDSNSNYNGPDAAIAVSSAWVASSGPTDFNTGYWWHSTKSESDVASFAFYVDQDATLEVEAWWTSGTNRSAGAPYLIYDASNTRIGTAYANQQQNGGKWNSLGSFNFTKGWNYIDLSVWAPSGYVVVADAVRVHTP